jgi:predicted nucleotidyltransferase component of viral defense system
MPYETPAGLRDALEARLANDARAHGVDLNRLRRRAAFERLLVRLEANTPNRWVLKGGMAVEVRLGNRARMTKDLDLAVRGDGAMFEGNALRELLVEALTVDSDGDGFEFLVGVASSISPDEAGRLGWGMSVDVRLAGRTFAAVQLDVVARTEEITGTTRIQLHGLLDFAGLPRRSVDVVNSSQHFAEKLHAYTRDYGARGNTRVKDLPDLVLLIEHGIDPAQAYEAAELVFVIRGTHPLPDELPDPPAGWEITYARYVDQLDVQAATTTGAIAVVRRFWAEARATRSGGSGSGAS